MKITYNRKAIPNIMKQHNLSAGEFARKAGISRQLYHYLAKAKTSPRVNTLLKIAESFGLKMDYFFIVEE